MPSASLLLSPERMDRCMRRIAHQINEEAAGQPIYLFGIDRRGFTLAHRIFTLLKQVSEDAEPTLLEDFNGLLTKNFGFLIVIDDVIFSGRTVFKTLLHYPVKEAPALDIKTVFLIDRGHRKFPIAADFVGLRCTTKLNEHVEVRFKELHGEDGVYLHSSNNK